jgi:hypothetical protein
VLEKRGNKYFYKGLTQGTDSTSNRTNAPELSGVSSLSIELNPEQDTTIAVACRPNGLTDDVFRKYVRYQRYVSYDLPSTPNITNQITFTINGDSCEIDGTCPPDDKKVTCTPIFSCSTTNANLIVNSCNKDTTYCPNGCTDGACNDVTTCTPTPNYCIDDTVVFNDANCQLQVLEQCPYGCTAGVCNDRPISGPMSITSNLVANPGIVLRGETTRISWEVENADTCLIAGGNDRWTSKSGNYESSPLEQTTDFSLVCMDFNGQPTRQSVTVRIAPTWQEL